MKRFTRKNNFQDHIRSSNRRQYERSPQSSKQETVDAQVLCYNCRKPGHFKANCPHPIVRKYQDHDTSTSSPKEAIESSKRSGKQELTNSQHERRRNAMVVNEPAGEELPETSTSSSSSESESSGDEKGLLCLFSKEEEADDLCLMANDDEVNSQTSSSTQIEISSENERNPNETIFEMMMDFKVIKNTYSKLKEENSRLLTSDDELRRVKIDNIKLAIAKDQLEKQVLLFKEQCTERELREQHLCEVLDSFNKSSNLMDQLVNGLKPPGERTGIGYDLSSPSHILLNKSTDIYSHESFKSAFVQGPTQMYEPMIKIKNRDQPQSTSQSKGNVVQRIVEPRNGNYLKGNPRHNTNVKRNGPKGNRPSLYYQKGQPTRKDPRT
ncbi:PREDICTED: lisH domain-containing protein C1711.05-like [Ipomoea nil]|uniref:lisH domain-containing protein C1711.05-like n=1 Tax=Ipomoea nil TaxID=35883 RepID=UPI000901CDCD|nr:PREDICTED: lisH domain-containing protein C1711.05-like [Ipomoea nil]